jgi:probable HAF family extracellular repeat protein
MPRAESKEINMSNRIVSWIATIALIALALSVQLAAQHTRYKLIDLGTLGGPNSGPAGFSGGGVQLINNQGTAVGTSETLITDADYPNVNPIYQCCPDPYVFHAFSWRKGKVTDLAPQLRLDSSVANWISGSGLIAGVSETGATDPLTGWPEAHAALWKEGKPIDLGTLGGNESFAYALNDRGEVVGGAANTILDPISAQGWGTQTRAFAWQGGVMQDLGTLGGPDAFATGINEAGLIVGCSYTAPPNITFAPFLWQNGGMIKLGTFGGTNGCAFQINNRGQVMGQSNLPGDQVTHGFFWERGMFSEMGNFGGSVVEPFWLNDLGEVVGKANYPGDVVAHAFLWKKGKMMDLGTAYPTCSSSGSVGLSINSNSQIVGNSWCDDSAFTAFLWENGGPMVDLNSLIPANSSLQVFAGCCINDRGEILAAAFLLSTEAARAVLLVPCEEGTQRCRNGAPSAATARRANTKLTAAQRGAIRKLIRQDAKGATQRYRVPGLKAQND